MVVLVVLAIWLSPESPDIQIDESSLTVQKCNGTARCITGIVTNVVDGDTIRVGEDYIRLALTSTPEMSEAEGVSARTFVKAVCPVGSSVIVDEDDGQTEGSYGRIIGKVTCNERNLNEVILNYDHGIIDTSFCEISEFGAEDWAVKYGC